MSRIIIHINDTRMNKDIVKYVLPCVKSFKNNYASTEQYRDKRVPETNEKSTLLPALLKSKALLYIGTSIVTRTRQERQDSDCRRKGERCRHLTGVKRVNVNYILSTRNTN